MLVEQFLRPALNRQPCSTTLANPDRQLLYEGPLTMTGTVAVKAQGPQSNPGRNATAALSAASWFNWCVIVHSQMEGDSDLTSMNFNVQLVAFCGAFW